MTTQPENRSETAAPTIRAASAKESPSMYREGSSRYFSRIDIIVDISETLRRVLEFTLIDARLVLETDFDQERKTKRHAWINSGYRWRRLGIRDNTGPRRPTPKEAVDLALDLARKQIHYRDELL